jgi:hypothetical protein
MEEEEEGKETVKCMMSVPWRRRRLLLLLPYRRSIVKAGQR